MYLPKVGQFIKINDSIGEVLKEYKQNNRRGYVSACWEVDEKEWMKVEIN
jgi:hypothetical protein